MQNNFEPMVFDLATEENDNLEESDILVETIDELDLEAFSSSYTGLGKLNRLIFLADHCPSYKVEALKMAVAYVQTTFNVSLYQKLHRKLQDSLLLQGVAAGGNNFNLPDIAGGAAQLGAIARIAANIPQVDMGWVESRSKKAALKLEKLDSELKASKVNSIKESIRRGHDDLGDHYLDCGDLPNALKCYSRSRDYCTTLHHVTNMCFNVIKVSIYLNNWSHVLSYVAKAQAAPEPDKMPTASSSNSKAQVNQMATNLNCAAGLAYLAASQYKLAAKNFLDTQLDACDMTDILTPLNVAVYGVLCALATFSRQELHTLVITSSSFKLFLELDPQLRDVIFKFYQSEYATCLKLLDSMMNFYLLDMFLARHVKTLYSSIRNRALIQYFSPYQSADMERMAVALNTNITSLENELIELILEDQIQARIDSHNKILFAKTVDERRASFERALVMGKDYEMKSKALLLRAALIRCQIHVKSPPRDNGHAQGNACDVPVGGNNCAPMQSSSSNRS